MLAIVTSNKNYVDDLLQKYGKQKDTSPIGTEIYKCNYKEHEFVIVVTGYGKVNVASALASLLKDHQIRVIVSVGTAGSLLNTNEIFSAIVPNGVLSYDVDFSPLGYQPGGFPEMSKSSFQANEDLCDCAKRACGLCATNCSNDLIATGDMFVCNNRLADSIRREYGAGAVDCDSGTIGQFCFQHNIPFVCIRLISNFANDNAVRQYRLYDDEASHNVQRITSKFLKDYYE